MERELSVYGRNFAIPTKFVAGHVCTAGDALALQSVFRNNALNFVSGRAKALLNGSASLTDEQAQALQKQIDGYAANHSFGRRASAGGADPVDRLALKLIRDRIRGQTKNVSADAINRAAAEVRADQPDKWLKYCDLARRRLEQEAQMKQLELALAAEVATPFGLGASPPS
jgi:hypothetical protein